MTRGFRIGTAFAGSLLFLAACGSSSGSPAPSASPAFPIPSGPVCYGQEPAAQRAVFPGTGGQPLVGFTVGTGSVGVVLANQAGNDACSWVGYANELVQKGYRVMAFDFNGEGDSAPSDGSGGDDVAAAAKYLRSRPGVSDIVLIGASRGGTAVLVAATNLQPPPKAVVSLSAPAAYNRDDAGSVVAGLTMPTLFVAADDDATFAADARSMSQKAPKDRATLKIVPGGSHGQSLVVPALEGAEQALAAINALLSAKAPAH
jgi:pimeloyl-ACP methyl ester carboxylesterase